MRMPTLYQFFRHQLGDGFAARGITEPATVDYVSEVLTRFAQTRSLYGVTDTQGRALEYVVDFLAAARGDDSGRSDRARERSVLRHLGEYTLFMSGLFRERLKARGELNYYLAQGASAYGQCADVEPQSGQRAVFRRLHASFIGIADSLDDLRRERLPLSLTATPDNMLTALWRR